MIGCDEQFLRAYGVGCRGKHADGFTLEGAEPHYAPDLALEPKHTEVRLEFDLPGSACQGSVTHRVRANSAGARSIRLNAVAFEEVRAADADGRPLAFTYDGREIRITWQEPFAIGEERRVRVHYHVRKPASGLFFSAPDAAYPKASLYAVSDHETERARYWLPCVDYPSVRCRFDAHLTAAEGLTILANGALISEERDGKGRKTAHWQLDFPCPSYLFCIAIGNFVRHDEPPVDGRPVAYFAPDHYTVDQLRRTFGRTPAMMRWMEKRLGHPIPFPKYFQVAVPAIGGAMENISLVTWFDFCVLDEKWALEFQETVDSVNLHEMAHSYFGDAVVCRHFEHSWLKESWAVFMETVYLEENTSGEDAEYDLHLNAQAYFDEVEARYVRPIVTRVYTSSWDLFDRHLYPGGAWRIHMLRARVGADAFWRAVHAYLAEYQQRLVETDDFRRALEAHSGLNLTRFFDQWIYSAGHPKLKVAFSHDKERGEGTLVIEQTQRDEKRGIGFFQFDLDISWEDATGGHSVTVSVEGQRTTTVLAMPTAPLAVLLDPSRKVLFALDFNPGDEMLKRALAQAKALHHRIWAAGELIKGGSRPSFAAVGAAMKSERYWGVRAAVAGLLGECKGAVAVEVLAELLLVERDPRVLAPLAAACGKFRDARLRKALLEFLGRDLPYRAHAAALEALGAQRDERDLELLIAASRRDGWHSIVRNGACAGLGLLRSERAFAELRARLGYGAEPESARPALVGAFGASAHYLTKERRDEAVDLLIDLTRDPMPRVRMRAAAALAALASTAGSPEAIGAIRALQRSHPQQDFPVLERAIRRLRAGNGEDGAALKKQVDELQERFRKLEERLLDAEARLKKPAERVES